MGLIGHGLGAVSSPSGDRNTEEDTDGADLLFREE